MPDLHIITARRTPQGRFLGALAKHSSVDLAAAAGEAMLADIDRTAIDQLILGSVLTAGQGMNIARQLAVRLNLPIETPAFTVNMMCASGLQAVALAAQAIRAGDANVVLCGGTESMSNAPHLLQRSRRGYKLGDGQLVDSLLRDGLIDSFDHQHMAETAERLAQQQSITRDAQDAYAAQSQQRYAEAHAAGRFIDELVELDDLAHDEHPRPDTTPDTLATLKPAFRADGTVTAGNAAGINDGAAMLLVCDADTAQRHGWQPLARITAWTTRGCDPKVMGLGPVHATQQLCQRMNCALDTFDTIELNEAFAAQTLACLQQMNLAPDAAHVNPDGGAIALGHPIGASGARLVTHLAHRIARGDTQRGLATLCVGGGMGGAMAVERM
ncbi:MAG: acetyl-CoA C-acyltransferase [Phycisphaeraceae bacterium]